MEFGKVLKSEKSQNVLNWDSSDAVPLPDEGILRDFDLNLKFGPCCTISRTDRFHRAHRLGLNPPQEVIAIIEKTGNKESVLDFHLRQIASGGVSTRQVLL